jgi:multidrug efflux pump subunit AcrA (membrane-fusion protein)
MPKSRTTWSLMTALVLLVALLVIGVVPRWRQNAELVAASTAPDAALVPVSVVAPKRADGPVDLVLPSNIQAIQEAAIYARTSGYVRERNVDIGDRVASGKVLAQIDTPELDQELGQARAALAQTRSSLAQAVASLSQAQANHPMGSRKAGAWPSRKPGRPAEERNDKARRGRRRLSRGPGRVLHHRRHARRRRGSFNA